MKEILFYKSLLSPEHTNSLGIQIKKSLKEKKINDKNILTGLEKIIQTNERLTALLNTSLVNPYTKQFNEQILLLENLYIGGRYNVKSYTYWTFDLHKKDAADKLFEVFNRHGNYIQNFGYHKKHSVFSSLIQEMKNENMIIYLECINLVSWLNELEKGVKQIETIHVLKATYKSRQESVEKRNAQAPVSKSIKELVSYLNTSILYNKDNSELIEVFKSVEGLVKEFTNKARIGKALKKSKNSNE